VGSYLQADAIILYGFSPSPAWPEGQVAPAFSIDLPVKRTAALLTAERQLLSHLIESHRPLCISGYWLPDAKTKKTILDGLNLVLFALNDLLPLLTLCYIITPC
jgi:hypothetical protein